MRAVGVKTLTWAAPGRTLPGFSRRARGGPRWERRAAPASGSTPRVP